MADLQGKRIMLVESDAFLASYVGHGLTAAGAELVGPFASAYEAATRVDEADAVVCTIDGDETALTLPTLWTSARAPAERAQPSCFYRPYGAFQIVEAVERLLLTA
jgi:hypothetical protein